MSWLFCIPVPLVMMKNYKAEPFKKLTFPLASVKETKEEYEALLAKKDEELEAITKAFELKIKELAEEKVSNAEFLKLQKVYRQKARSASNKISLSEDETYHRCQA